MKQVLKELAEIGFLVGCLVFAIAAMLTIAGCKSQEIPAPEPKEFVFKSFVEKNLGPATRATTPPVCDDWITFLSGIVKAESNWRSDAVYEEKFIDSSTGARALSVGYFQLSVGDKRNYKTPYCQQLTPNTLKDPQINTGCALEIVEALTKKGRSLGAYWSTARDGKVKCLN